MREKKTHLYFDSEERKILLHSLVELKISLFNRADIPTPLTNSSSRLSTLLLRE